MHYEIRYKIRPFNVGSQSITATFYDLDDLMFHTRNVLKMEYGEFAIIYVKEITEKDITRYVESNISEYLTRCNVKFRAVQEYD